jgi:hypothetical protein
VPALAKAPNERTTAATDLLLALVCLGLMPGVAALAPRDPWRVTLWLTIFGLLAASSLAGAAVHGFTLPPRLRAAVWQPLYLMLGLAVALFVVAAVRDWQGEAAARRLLAPAVAAGIAFWVLTLALGGKFVVFVIYEVTAMLVVLAIYLLLARQQVPGAQAIAVAVLVNLAGAVLQASRLQVTVVWPFDHTQS